MHLQLNDSSVAWEPGDVIFEDRELALTKALRALVGSERARELLLRVGPNGLEHMSKEEIAASTGVPLHVAGRVTAARTLGRTLSERHLPRGTTPERLFAALPREFGLLERELLVGFALTGANRIKAIVVLSVGGLAGAAIMTRDALAPMIRHGAAAFALAHNHPSGDKTPSREDILLTNVLTRSAALVGMPLVDHLVVARDGFTSFLEAGLMLDASEIHCEAHLRDKAGAP